MKVVIIKYNAGNIYSVKLALQRLGIEPIISNDPAKITDADKVIFPGVGEASSAMNYLVKRGLDKVIKRLSQPVLGICLGLQLMCEYSDENETECLGIFPLKVKKFPPLEKIPHMGWNTITGLSSPLFNGVADESYVYFVHSYFAETGIHTCATTDYMLKFSAALQENNYFGTQFHPEKSGTKGEQILRNFIEI